MISRYLRLRSELSGTKAKRHTKSAFYALQVLQQLVIEKSIGTFINSNVHLLNEYNAVSHVSYYPILLHIISTNQV